jgi:hypothetical protein
VKFVATKKVRQQIFFHPSRLMLFLDPGSGMGKNQNPGSGINIPDPQHCCVFFDNKMSGLLGTYHKSLTSMDCGIIEVRNGTGTSPQLRQSV